MRDERVAAIDCGTNSIRLLVADSVGGVLHEVDRRLTIVRLGQGVDATGVFAADALRRTFAACDDYAAAIQEYGADRIRFVATSASRDAGNRDEFFAGVRDRLGVEPEIINGAEEAALSFRGATSGLAELAGRGAVPRGGHRWRLDRAGAGRPDRCHGRRESLDIGSVRMTERHLPVRAGHRRRGRGGRRRYRLLARGNDVPLDQARSLIGVAGTITTLAAIALELPEYDRSRMHHARIDGDRLTATARWLVASTARRAGAPGRRSIRAGST